MESTENGNGKALAVRTEVALSPYEPRNYEQALAMAGVLAKATKQPMEVVFLKMAAAAAIGIDAVTALQAIDVIDGPSGPVPSYRARLMVALCLRRTGVCEYIECVESDATHATWRAKRAGRAEKIVTYGMEDAQRAKLVKSGGAYEKDPESQFNARASARLARLVFPDIVLNMYTREELEDATESHTPAPVSPLPGGKPVILEGEIVEPPSDEARIVKALDAATTGAEVKALAAEALKLWPAERPALVKAAHVEAKKRTGAATTAKLAEGAQERQAGEEG